MQHTVRSTLYAVHCMQYIVCSTLYTIHCTKYIVHSTLYTVQCTLYTVHCTLYNVHCTMYNVQCTSRYSRFYCVLLFTHFYKFVCSVKLNKHVVCIISNMWRVSEYIFVSTLTQISIAEKSVYGTKMPFAGIYPREKSQ